MDTGDVRAKFEAFGWDAVEIDGHDMTRDRRGAGAQPDARPPGRDRLPDQEGPRRLLHGGPVRLPRQAAASPEQAARRWRSWSELEATYKRKQGAAGPMTSDLTRPKTEPSRRPRGRRTATRSSPWAKPSRGGRTRRRSGRLHPVDQVRQAVPRALLQLGAAEANMMSMACGLAATGKVPYASTFAIFATGRAYDQVRLGIAHNELKVRIGASHGGVSLGEDGASHQMIEDIALMRAMPKMQVIVPADYNQAYRAVIESYERFDGADLHALRTADDAGRLRRDPRRRWAPASTSCERARTSRSSPAATWSGARWKPPRRWSARTGSRPRSSTSRSSSRSTPRRVLGSLAKTGRRRDGRGAPRRRRPRPTRSAQVAAEQHPVPIFALGMGDEFGLSGTGEACMEHFGLTARGDRRPGPRGAAPEADRLAPADSAGGATGTPQIASVR